MSDAALHRFALRAPAAYVPGAVGPRAAGIRELASNENPLGPAPGAATAARRALAQVHRYPEHDAGSLRARVAARWELDADAVIVTPGITPFIDLLARALLGPGTSAVVSERSFVAYAMAVEAAGATLLRAPMTRDATDLDAVRATIRPDTRLVFLDNPNNPTGTAFGAAAFDAFLDRVPEHVLVVLDEAYAEYGEGLPVGAALVRAGRAVVALRTFSKAHALAGLRVGYGLGPPALMRPLARLATTFGVTLAAQSAACAALDDEAHLARSVAANRAGRDALTAGLAAMGLAPAPSAASFVYVDLRRPAGPVAARMLEAGVRVRALGGAWGAPDALRISVGRPADNSFALAALARALDGRPG